MAYSKEQLRTIFQNKFDREAWKAIVIDIFGANKVRRENELFTEPDEPETGYYMGSIDTPDSYRIGLFYYKINSGSVAHKKVGLRNLVKRFINQNWGEFDAAIVVFDDSQDWRLSFVCDIKEEATAPKRYTFVFGERDNFYRTAIERFSILQGLKPTFENIRKAFSVDALSDDFFDEYRELYADFVQYITGKRYVKESNKWIEREISEPNYQYETTFERNDKHVRDYIKKMFGRIVFLYFLQRKGWLDGNRQYMHDLFYTADKKDDFLDGVLEPLFFEVLNTDKPHRTAEAQALPGSENIPYLNGGLFARDEIDALNCAFPETLFKQLFDFLDSYNFTIDENDTDDAEIGIDPEMLGRIFENLLEDNKDKGAFYTPKEIVDYMCQESIIAYLLNGLPERSHSLIRTFVKTFDATELNPDQRLYIRKKLQAVKICDPAIGSGAFPMGLVNLLFKLYVAMKSDTDTAKMKRHIMEQNIYGVDIEQGAVDIARLRFWLAMIVEEKEPIPLPNLHFKIMQGNSLLESYNGVDLSDLTKLSKNLKHGESRGFWDTEDSERESLISSLKSYYKTSDHSKRDVLFNDIINNVRRQLFDKGITLPKGVDPSANTDFFLWHTWFSDVFEKGGFDIVIGNPPYGANIDDLITVYEKIYPKTSKGYKDIYKYFFDQGLRILRPQGILSYITPSTFLRQPRYGDVRCLLLKYNILQILDLGEEVFEEAVVPVAVSLLKKSEKEANTLFADLRSYLTNDNIDKVLSNISFIYISQSYWEGTANNSFIEEINYNNDNILTLETIIDFKDAGINYQRVKVGLAQKGKSDLSSRLLYEGERECDEHVMFWKGADIEEFFISTSTHRYVRPNISLASNERVILNSDYFSIYPKLIWRQTAPYPICAIDDRGIWFGRSIQGGVIKSEYKTIVSYEYLCGLLNSTYIRDRYEHAVKEGGRVFPQVKLEKLKPLPIIIAKPDVMRRIEDLVRNIIKSKKDNADSAVFEQELNELITNLYSSIN